MKLDNLFHVNLHHTNKENFATMVVTPAQLNLMGKCHGGNQAYLCIRAMQEAISLPSFLVHFSISYLSSVPPKCMMTAYPQILHNGRQLIHAAVQVMVSDKLVATATALFTTGRFSSVPAVSEKKEKKVLIQPYYLHEEDSLYAHSAKSILAMNDRKTMAAMAAQTKGEFALALRSTQVHADEQGILSPCLFPILTDISSGQSVSSLAGLSVTSELSCTVVGSACVGETLTAHSQVCTTNGPLLHTQGEIHTENGLVATTNAVFFRPSV